MRELAGRTAFVTGGDSGIGAAIAEVLCEAGVRVVICGLSQDSVDAATARLSSHGTVEGVVLDVRDRAAYAALADRVDQEHGGLDILVNNAGVGFLAPALEATFEQWDWVLGINLTGIYNGIRTFVPRMVAAGRPGHVVSVSSIAGLVGVPGTVYSAAKFGVVGLMESLALELRDTAVRATVVTPGLIRTNIGDGPEPPGGRYALNVPPPPPGAGAPAPLMTAREVGERVVQAIRDEELFVITHVEHRALLEARFGALLRSTPTGEVDPGRAERELRILGNPVYAEQRPSGSAPAQ